MQSEGGRSGISNLHVAWLGENRNDRLLCERDSSLTGVRARARIVHTAGSELLLPLPSLHPPALLPRVKLVPPVHVVLKVPKVLVASLEILGPLGLQVLL